MAGEYKYKDPNGNIVTGYLSDDNQMYTDSSMSTRIPYNSTVTGANGTVYYMTSKGGVTANELAAASQIDKGIAGAAANVYGTNAVMPTSTSRVYLDGATGQSMTGYDGTDGKVYADAKCTVPISDYSTVMTDNGLYTRTPYGSVKTTVYDAMLANQQRADVAKYGEPMYGYNGQLVGTAYSNGTYGASQDKYGAGTPGTITKDIYDQYVNSGANLNPASIDVNDFIASGGGQQPYSSTINSTPTAYSAASGTGGNSSGGLVFSGDVNAAAQGYINGIYEAKTQAATAALKAAYDQNVLAGKAARDAIPGTYYDAKNSTAAQSAIQQNNFNEYAAARGLNSGAGGQAQLAYSNTLQSNLSGLDRQQAKDISAVDLQLAQLGAKYQNDIAAAIAEGKFNEAQALYNQYLTDQQNAIQQAQFDEQMALQQQQLAIQQQQYQQSLTSQQNETAYNRAADAAQATGIYDGLAAFGWNPLQIAIANFQSGRTPKFTDYGSATQYLQKIGLDASGIITETEWQRQKSTGSETTETAFTNYGDYLNAYISYMLTNS